MTFALPRFTARPPPNVALRSPTSSSRCRSRSVSPRLRDIALVAAGSLLIYLTAQVVVPPEPVPFTAQNFGVLVVGGSLGLRRGGLAAFLYVALGVVGLPFFAEHKGGIIVILGAPAATSSASSSPAPSSGGSRSSAGTAASSARSARRRSAR